MHPRTAQTYVLPDLLSSCPLRDATNPYYIEAGEDSRNWINSFNLFNDRKRAFFMIGCNELLVSHVYPYAGHEQFRTLCDFINVLFVVDEVSDDQGSEDANTTGKTFLSAMADVAWDDGSILARITKEFRERLVRGTGPNSMKRFLELCVTYTDCVAREAKLREYGEILDVASYIQLRRENSAVRLCYAIAEYALGIDLPDEVFCHPVFLKIYYAAVDHVCWANDVYSYNREQATGHKGNNIITVLMQEKGYSLQEAVDFVGLNCAKLMETFMSVELRARLPSWGPKIDADVACYFKAIGHWVIGNLVWSFETQRYFGTQHEEVKQTRVVALRPSELPEGMESDSESENDSCERHNSAWNL
ncbi:hypothetical protein AX16_002332 [Volvariella volvacea WC 439]|nr:hypothetical protein AX16_002332 [Volvariella volvacea WC 439]